MIFHLHQCPDARKRASAVFIECIRIFWIVILDSLPSMLEAKAFLRDTSTGIAGGFRSQQNTVQPLFRVCTVSYIKTSLSARAGGQTDFMNLPSYFLFCRKGFRIDLRSVRIQVSHYDHGIFHLD